MCVIYLLFILLFFYILVVLFSLLGQIILVVHVMMSLNCPSLDK